MVSDSLKAKLLHQRYQLVGDHSAVKPCLWLKRSLRGQGHCYKEQFYGISSHRCMQMTPSVAFCTQSCVFCWRNTTFDPDPDIPWEEPEKLVDDCIAAHRQAISGFGGFEGVDKKKFRQAQDPNQVAISLAGEPMTYPHMSPFIGELTKRGMTSYLVTNGTYPQRLAALDDLPTNLYVSLTAPDRKTHERVNAPLIPDAWERIGATLDLFPSIDTTKVVRITSVSGLNMRDPKGYAKLLSRASPDHVEVKAFMFVGGSRDRLTMDNMPSHDTVRDFAKAIASEISYELADEKRESRVVLLSK